MNITPDFSEAVEQNTVVAPGLYKARVEAVEQKTSKAGNNYLQWTMGIFGAEGDQARFNNHKLWHNTMLSGKGAGILKDFLTATIGEARQFQTDEVLGKEVSVMVKNTVMENGNPRAEVGSVKKLQ
jgi:hypothetical protein